MKNILVTGATGFVGGYVIEELLKQGCRITATSKTVTKAQSRSWFSQVTFIPFDLENFSDEVNYAAFFGNPGAVIHLAWEGLPNYTNEFHLSVNLPRHAAFLRNLVLNGVRDVTIAGTCLEYGMREGRLSEDMQPLPQNAYAQAKDQLRLFLEDLQVSKAFNLKWVRLFYMYGEGQNPKSLFSQLDRALKAGDETFNMSGGMQVRDFLPVEKVAEYLVQIAVQDKVMGIINCCSANPVTVKDFVEEYISSRGKKIKLNLGHYPYADYEPMKFWGDDRKLKLIVTKNE